MGGRSPCVLRRARTAEQACFQLWPQVDKEQLLLSLCGSWISLLNTSDFSDVPLTGKQLHRDSGLLQQFVVLELSGSTAVLESGSPTAGDPLARRLWAWGREKAQQLQSSSFNKCGGTALESLGLGLFFPF